MASLYFRGFRGAFSFIIKVDRATIRDGLVVGAATGIELFESYLRYKNTSREQELKYNGALKTGLGGKGEDHKVDNPTKGSLRVLLHCFTEKKFLEVLHDFESGRMKRRLQREFFNIGIETEGLVVEIENIKEVKEKAAAIRR